MKPKSSSPTLSASSPSLFAYVRSAWSAPTMVFLLIILFSQRQSATVEAVRIPNERLLIERECIFPTDDYYECNETDPKFINRTLNVTVLLPFDPYYKVSLKRVGQAIYLGFKKVRELQLLPDYQISLSYKNSNCSNIYAPLEFIEDVCQKRVHVFFGPSCDLALAPVARWLKFYNTPLLTAGGLTFDYTEPKKAKDTEYYLTTRTGFSFKEIAEFILQKFVDYKWKKTMLIYNKSDMGEVSGLHTCKFFMSTLAEYLKDKKLQFGNFDLETNNVNASLKEILVKQLGLEYAIILELEGHMARVAWTVGEVDLCHPPVLKYNLTCLYSLHCLMNWR